MSSLIKCDDGQGLICFECRSEKTVVYRGPRGYFLSKGELSNQDDMEMSQCSAQVDDAMRGQEQ